MNRGGDLNGLKGLREVIRAPLADQSVGLNQGPDALLQEKGVPLGACNQEPRERLNSHVVSKECSEEFLGTLRVQRVKAELAVKGLTAPAVLVLGPVVDQQEAPCGRETRNQAIEESLGL